MPRFSSKSLAILSTVDPRLQELFNAVVKRYDCAVVSGLRTTEMQQMLYAQGRTMPGNIVTYLDGIEKKSRHQSGRAADVIPYPVDWNDTKRFNHFAGFVRGVAFQMGIDIVWGGDWDNDFDFKDQRFHDLGHFELR